MRRVRLFATVMACAFLLVGCTQGDPESNEVSGPSGHASTGSDTHTMPDGTVMPDSEMSHGAESTPAAGPSAAARMVCGGDVKDDVRRILGLGEAPAPSSSWRAPLFACTYDLESGPLVLTVHDATNAAAGRAHFDSLRRRLGDARTIKGVYSLGLPAYETADGTVVFIRDGKTLEVDATRLSEGLGPDGDMSPAEVAYAVATSVLACWEHHA